MLTIRLSRVGTKNKPMYRLIVSEKSRDLYGRPLEILGSYNPHSKDLQVKGERVKYWLSQGSQMSPTVNNLFVEKKIIEGSKVTASKAGKSKTAPEAEAETAAAPAAGESKTAIEEKTETANQAEEKPAEVAPEAAPVESEKTE